MANKNLHSAKTAKNDEFYTQLADIEREVRHYKQHFKDKVVLCNCDDPRVSNFFHYFSYNFEQLGLKKLITTCYKNDNSNLFSQNTSERAIYLEYTDDKDGNRVPNPAEIGIKKLEGDGDFRSAECIELLKQADIVCTNPPFSLFREYVVQLMEYEKKFLIIGNMNALKYKEIFKFIVGNKIWSGYGFNQSFVFKTTYENILPANVKFCEQKGYFGKNYIKTPAVNWYTNLEISKRYENLTLYKHYTPEEYPTYDNYDAIEVSKVADIPMDYDGLMGVPITFLGVYNPEQFEIIGLADDKREINDAFIQGRETYLDEQHKKFVGMVLHGKATYSRILIKRK